MVFLGLVLPHGYIKYVHVFSALSIRCARFIPFLLTSFSFSVGVTDLLRICEVFSDAPMSTCLLLPTKLLCGFNFKHQGSCQLQ